MDRSFQNHFAREGKPPADTGPWIAQVVSAITSAAGTYSGQLFVGTVSGTGAAGDDLTLPGALTSGRSCIIKNVDESTDQGNADGTHALNVRSWVTVAALQKTQNTAGAGEASNAKLEAIVHGGVGDQSFVTPIDPTGTSADTTTWTRGQKPAVGGDGAGCVIYLVTRVVWDSTAGELAMMQRKISIDGRGMIFKVGAEEKVSIDDATSCT